MSWECISRIHDEYFSLYYSHQLNCLEANRALRKHGSPRRIGVEQSILMSVTRSVFCGGYKQSRRITGCRSPNKRPKSIQLRMPLVTLSVTLARLRSQRKPTRYLRHGHSPSSARQSGPRDPGGARDSTAFICIALDGASSQCTDHT